MSQDSKAKVETMPVGDPGSATATTEVKRKPQATLQIPITLDEIRLVQGLPRKARKEWSKRVADQIYKLVRGYQPVPTGFEPIPEIAEEVTK